MTIRSNRLAGRWIGWALAAFVCCGTPLALATTTISDVAGDTDSFDLLSISGGYDATKVYLSAQFRAGTFPSTSSDYGFFWALNTDLDSGTGVQPGGGVFFPPQGADFLISGFPPLTTPPQARIFEATSSGSSLVGTVDLVVEPNRYSLTIPKALLGNFTGAALFALVTGPGNGPGAFLVNDEIGFIGTGPSTFVGPAMTPVPEAPVALLLLAGAIVTWLTRLLRSPTNG